MKCSIETYCGGYCGACPTYFKTINGTIQDLAYDLGRPVEDIACYGCKSEQVSNDWCRDCFIKACCIEKEFDTCIECDIYPCNRITHFQNDKRYPHRKEHDQLLRLIKEKGMDSWFTTCIKRWSCSNCNNLFTWDAELCLNCGNKLNGYVNYKL